MDFREESIYCCLFDCIQRHKNDLFAEIIEANNIDLNYLYEKHYSFARTLLMHTLLNRNLTIFELLLNYDIDLNIVDNNGDNILYYNHHYSSCYKKLTMFELIINHKSKININSKNNNGITILHLLCSKNQYLFPNDRIKMLKLLLE